eukprot:3042916-Pyramimonas_sp.AAC.1
MPRPRRSGIALSLGLLSCHRSRPPRDSYRTHASATRLTARPGRLGSPSRPARQGLLARSARL